MHAYPQGFEPNHWNPQPSNAHHRFVLGCLQRSAATAPLVAIGMNPSYANESVADATVLRVIEASAAHGYSGWVMLNLYPERATSPDSLLPYDGHLSAANCAAIDQTLAGLRTPEVLAAWGNLGSTVRTAKNDVLQTLYRRGVRLFTFDDLTLEGEPRHPNPRGARLPMLGPKRYLT